MSINQILPFISTALMLGFTIYVFQRYFVRRALPFLFWGIGLAMFGLGSFAEVYLSLTWSRAVFVMWYLFGAILKSGLDRPGDALFIGQTALGSHRERRFDPG